VTHVGHALGSCPNVRTMHDRQPRRSEPNKRAEVGVALNDRQECSTGLDS